MSRILDNLYLGSYNDAKDQSLLINFGITHIVTVGAELKTPYPRSFKYLYIPAYDSPEYKLIIYFDEIADFIHNAIEREKGKVFVHCYWGISRSTASVMAYLIKYQNMEPTQARYFIKQRRSIIYPNEGFVKQLETFSKKVVSKPVEKKEENVKLLYGSATLTKILSQSKAVSPRDVQSASITRSASKLPMNKLDSKAPELQSSLIVGFGSTGHLRKSSFTSNYKTLETKKEATFDHEYSCKDCGMKVFKSADITHNAQRDFGGACNAIYLRYMSWIGELKSNVSKIFCPNPKCKTTLGFANLRGGGCPCGKHMDKVYAIYPLRVSHSKAKLSSYLY